jgi:hypothetical protein
MNRFGGDSTGQVDYFREHLKLVGPGAQQRDRRSRHEVRRFMLAHGSTLNISNITRRKALMEKNNAHTEDVNSQATRLS